MWKEIMEQPEVLEGCLQRNISVTGDLTKYLNARKINAVYIAGRGTSDHAAIYAKYILELLTGIPVALAAPSIVTVYKRRLKLKNCLVIGISQSGEAADVLEVVREGKLNGAVTLAVTNTPSSPLAQEAAFHLDCAAGPELSVAATKTFTAQMILLAFFAAAWSDYPELKDELAGVPEGISSILKNVAGFTEAVERHRFIEECFMLARGVNYAAALEAALKIQETSYVRAKAFAASDFFHGPIAMIERDIPVMALVPGGPSFDYMHGALRKLINRRMELLVVSDQNKALQLGSTGIRIPETGNDFISPFFCVTVFQMFACMLAVERGINPDRPRGLKKVTVTR